MARENGFEVPVDDETKAKLGEMDDLEKRVGKTGLLAIHPMLRTSRKDLWQVHMPGK